MEDWEYQYIDPEVSKLDPSVPQGIYKECEHNKGNRYSERDTNWMTVRIHSIHFQWACSTLTKETANVVEWPACIAICVLGEFVDGKGKEGRHE